MTTTHLEKTPAVAITPPPMRTSEAAQDDPKSPSADSSFSDAYKEQPEGTVGQQADNADQETDISDDYAMAVDSDGEEQADSQDISQAKIESDTKSLPVTVQYHPLPSSILSHDPPATDLAQPGQNTQPTPTNPNPIQPTVDATANKDRSDTVAAQISIEATKPESQTYDDVAHGGIDIQQLLDNITANAEKNDSNSTVTTPSTQSSKIPIVQGSSGFPTHASLPPRPNIPQKRPYPDDIQKYHAGAPGVPPLSVSYRPPGLPSALIAAGAPGTSTDPRGGLPPPPSASFRPTHMSSGSPISPASYIQSNRSVGQDRQFNSIESQDEADEADAKWGPDVQKIYDEFLADERMYVQEGLWDKFPLNSRLFIGNLPSEKVTKRDLFHVFHKYGKIAQVSIKNAYGFIQFHTSAACYAALDREQGAEVRGRKMHLEISKPQKNTRNAQAAGQGRRSRSPDYARGGGSERGGRGRNSAVDRYDGRAAPSYRSDEYGRPIRVRDDYRPVRSPTPPRGNFRGRDEYLPRGRDSYDSRDRRRSRSPYGHRDDGRYRERSLSPRGREAVEDADLQIPRRDPRDVPDVQVLLMEQLDRDFVSWVEGEMRGRGIKVEVMFLNPRLPLQAVIHRQILEGVHGVTKLDMRCQQSAKIPLQVFDRQGGANNVRFDEYQDLDPKIAAELILRAKQTQAPPQVQTPQYAQPQFATGQTYQPPAAAALPAANLASFVGQLDNATLQKLLGSYQLPPQQQNAPAVAANQAIDLAGLLGGLKAQLPQQSYQTPHSAPDPYANLVGNPALASLLQNAPPPQPPSTQPQSDQQVQNIMASLARLRR
ncbi:hypothetical protein N431DRAFT_493362 [Stipitochalara longipes BDJ]|nr:hypothetical protein N431DRAFT_493362 [Stipitochalara longipes BDJ]